jgi:hypothetical protein
VGVPRCGAGECEWRRSVCGACAGVEFGGWGEVCVFGRQDGVWECWRDVDVVEVCEGLEKYVFNADCDRYSLFYVLYPIGIAAEWWLMYRAVGPVGEVSPLLPPVFYFLLALYVPGEFDCAELKEEANLSRCVLHVFSHGQAAKEGVGEIKGKGVVDALNY